MLVLMLFDMTLNASTAKPRMVQILSFCHCHHLSGMRSSEQYVLQLMDVAQQ